MGDMTNLSPYAVWSSDDAASCGQPQQIRFRAVMKVVEPIFALS